MAPVTFVGRVGELDELDRRLAATPVAGLTVITVSGEPGFGKTALLRRLAAQHPGTRWATATPWEAATAGAVVSQLLQAAAATDPLAAAEELATALRGEDPSLVIVDDAQHTDLLSWQALSTLARHHRAVPALVVLATDGSRLAVQDLVGGELRLPGLGPAEVAELASARGRILHPSMADRLTQHIHGSPSHLLALLDEVPPQTWSRFDARLPAPAAVTRDVAVALNDAGAAGHALVFALAVLGEGATLADAARLAELEEPLAAVEAAARAGLLIAVDPLEPRLSDALTCAAVIDLAGAQATAAAHRRAADILADPVARLGHRVAATPVPDAALADEVDARARACGMQGAWNRAATLFRDASRLTAEPLLRDERLTRSVDALVAAGDCVGAAVLVPAVENLRETPLRNAVLAYLAILRGRATEADLRLRRAWEIVNADRDPDTAAFIAQRHVLHALVQCQGAQLVTWADRALQLADRDSPAGVEAAAIRGLGLLAAGQPKRAVNAYEDLSRRVRYGAQAQRVVMGRGWVQLVCDDIDAARASLESAVAAAALGGSTRITLWAYGWLARAQFVMGEWDSALDSVEQGRRLATSSGIVLVTPLLEWSAGQIAALRGDWAAAEAAVRAASQGGDYAIMRIPLSLLRAAIAEAKADYGAVRRILEPLSKIAAGTSLQEPGYWPWVDTLANAMVLDGDPAAADALLQPHEQRAAARGHRSAQARLGYARGRLYGATGDIDSAQRVFDDSLALLDGLPLRYDTARVNFAYGQTLRRAGKRRAADAVIGTARELYAALGADTYVARCDRELKAGGFNQSRDTRAGIELTPQEEAVTTLVTQGLSNREVAAELYVSHKTVQYHLTRIYAKLGVRSRSELVALRR
ncbi:LuxR C-terminal-related transcriptional regulator [Mycobacterium sp. Y57]|uniref:helix-turn-helix transcriptional regulator n=1 Tax=Mycolicibacterium xanthum TaxID=2796469 RepID=UPI001C85EB0D|nr:LuxR family transcriptional regulator [Mycolicibacterium xanthum]MBX7430717.1 LuxR C-terminal-related transcriptional regulator [Mycolicibacterium xanthum]